MSARNRSGLTIECSPRTSGSPRSCTQGPRLEISEIKTIPANVRGTLIVPSDDLEGSGFDLEDDAWKGEILPGFLFLGDRTTASDVDRLTTLEVTHILNVTEDVSNVFEDSAHLTYMRCPLEDSPEAASDISAQFDACVEFINSAREENGRVLVHCRAGVSRSAAVVIGYLMTQCKWDLKTSLHHVDTKRFVQPNSGLIAFLVGLERRLFGTNSCSAVDFGYSLDSGASHGLAP